jgi:hypothetical protein
MQLACREPEASPPGDAAGVFQRKNLARPQKHLAANQWDAIFAQAGTQVAFLFAN